MKLFIYAVIGFVAIAVIAGFFVVGSPNEERLRRFDERRLGDLQSLQWEVINYWQKKDALPAALADLNDNVRGYVIPQDPQDGSAYGYRATGDLSFSLCATFDREATSDVAPYGIDGPMPIPQYKAGYTSAYWSHAAGYACFDRTIDPELYRKNP